jgi:hypothetical protein
MARAFRSGSVTMYEWCDALEFTASGVAPGDRERDGGPSVACARHAALAVETFKFSTDPELVAKVTDIVGLYLEPPENVIVLCVGGSPRRGIGSRSADHADADRDPRASDA